MKYLLLMSFYSCIIFSKLPPPQDIFNNTATDYTHVSVLMVVPHNSSHKQNWEVVLGLDDGGAWNCFGGDLDGQESPMDAAVNNFFKDSLFGNVSLWTQNQMVTYVEKRSVYSCLLPNSSIMFVVPFADQVVNSYLTGFYDALYHQQRKTRYAKRKGLSADPITQLALVSWDALTKAIKASSSGRHIVVPARIVSKRNRAKKDTPFLVEDTITVDFSLWEQLRYLVNNCPYTKGPRAGVRVYS